MISGVRAVDDGDGAHAAGDRPLRLDDECVGRGLRRGLEFLLQHLLVQGHALRADARDDTAEEVVGHGLGVVYAPARRALAGVYAPNAKLRPLVVTPRAPTSEASPPSPPSTHARTASPPPPPRLDWATLHQRTFGTDVLQCPCGGRRTVRRVHLTCKAAEARLVELGVALPSRLLPRPTAPPQLVLEV